MPGFHHLALQCADLLACERFYREVLGLPVLRRWPRPEGGDRSVWLAVGDGFLALERAATARPAPPWDDGQAGLHLLSLRIGAGERQAWEERLRAAAVPVVRRTPHTLYVRDPEGNRVGLSHWPDAAGDKPPPYGAGEGSGSTRGGAVAGSGSAGEGT